MIFALAASHRLTDWESRMAVTLVDDAWPSALLLRRLSGDADSLAALRGITLGALLSILAFWMPLAISLIR